MMLYWIARRLAMGAAGYSAQCLREVKQGNEPFSRISGDAGPAAT